LLLHIQLKHAQSGQPSDVIQVQENHAKETTDKGGPAVAKLGGIISKSLDQAFDSAWSVANADEAAARTES
jgi:hypothetical protein